MLGGVWSVWKRKEEKKKGYEQRLLLWFTAFIYENIGFLFLDIRKYINIVKQINYNQCRDFLFIRKKIKATALICTPRLIEKHYYSKN